MKRFKILLSFFLLLAMIMVACQEDKLKPVNEDGPAPNPITNAQVENLPGGVNIKYTLPDSKDLLYVKAEYTLDDGIKREAKSSLYKNNISIEGFGDTKERNVTLYAVSRSEKSSAPVVVKISPLPPPVYDVYNSIVAEATFGGIIVKFKNPSAVSGNVNTNIVLGTLVWDPQQKEWKQVDTHYSGLTQDAYAVRGLKAEPLKFGFYAKDRWSNYTDTIEMELTPIYEEELNRAPWKDVRGKYPVPQVGKLPLSGNPMIESVDYSSSYHLDKMWDNNTGSMFHTKQSIEQPTWTPFDLGVKAKLSRYKMWQRIGSTWPYAHGNPHEWEIWGTNTPNDVNSWVLLDHEVMVKPSGLPVGQNSADDNDVANAGHDYNFPIDAPAVRYIAWKNIDNWDAIGGQFGFVHISELRIWGQAQ